MKLWIDETCYKITWYYDFIRADKKRTTCVVEWIQCGAMRTFKHINAVGYTECSPKDNFNKKIGRKISLARALKDFPREFRTKIYFMLGARDKLFLAI